MKIAGLQKLTLLDFPERVACTVFLGGCNFRCPFCHNSALVLPEHMPEEVSQEAFFDFLEKRVGVLDGVAITGGEPLLHGDIAPWIERIKSLGFAVKLDTNGSFPDRLQALVGQGLVDYVAMDIKNAPSCYAETAGVPTLELAPIEESVRFLMQGTVPYEFRTTIVRNFHNAERIQAIGRWIAGAQAYYLQNFVDSGACLCDNLQACSEAELEEFCQIAAKYVPNTHVRGV